MKLPRPVVVGILVSVAIAAVAEAEGNEDGKDVRMRKWRDNDAWKRGAYFGRVMKRPDQSAGDSSRRRNKGFQRVMRGFPIPLMRNYHRVSRFAPPSTSSDGSSGVLWRRYGWMSAADRARQVEEKETEQDEDEPEDVLVDRVPLGVIDKKEWSLHQRHPEREMEFRPHLLMKKMPLILPNARRKLPKRYRHYAWVTDRIR